MSTPSVSEIVPQGPVTAGMSHLSRKESPQGPGGGRGGRGRGRGRAGALGKEKARDLTSPLRMITKHSTQIHDNSTFVSTQGKRTAEEAEITEEKEPEEDKKRFKWKGVWPKIVSFQNVAASIFRVATTLSVVLVLLQESR